MIIHVNVNPYIFLYYETTPTSFEAGAVSVSYFRAMHFELISPNVTQTVSSTQAPLRHPKGST